MSTIAIIGAGPAGGALAQTLALRGRIDRVRLIDPHARVAEGKALDIAQSAPVDGFSTVVEGAADLAAAAGAEAVVLCDFAASGEITGESGLALVRDILRFEPRAPLLVEKEVRCGSLSPSKSITSWPGPILPGRVAG